MIKIITISATSLLLVLFSQAQKNCSVDNLSAEDKTKLKFFWEQLKSSLTAKDKKKLSELIHFPLYCGGCVLDSMYKKDDVVSIKRKEYENIDFSTFFDGRLLEYINRNPFPQNLDLLNNSSNVNNKCHFDFEYARVTNPPGRQDIISIEKISGKFKIVSGWSIP
jgi:hypothetical protein